MNTKEKWQAIIHQSDGCTNAPDLNFRECCVHHDYYYATKTLTRKEADKELRQCIQKEWGGIFLPWIYWGAVRIFGGKYYQ